MSSSFAAMPGSGMTDPVWVLNSGDHHQDPFVNPVTTCGVPRTIQDGDALRYLTSYSQASRRVIIVDQV